MVRLKNPEDEKKYAEETIFSNYWFFLSMLGLGVLLVFFIISVLFTLFILPALTMKFLLVPFLHIWGPVGDLRGILIVFPSFILCMAFYLGSYYFLIRQVILSKRFQAFIERDDISLLAERFMNAWERTWD